MKAAASRIFTMADQEAFARYTGDRNPMHMDPIAARRTQAGYCAVHGIHGLLWGLETLAASGLPLGNAAGMKVEFTRFIRLDAPVAVAVRTQAHDRVLAELTQEGQRVVSIDLALGPRTSINTQTPPDAAALPPSAPTDQALEALEELTGRLLPPPGDAQTFPHAAATLGRETVTSLGLLSTLVGMVAPGLHSIFSGFRIKFGATDLAAGLDFRVTRADDRFRLVEIDVTGAGFAGTVRAFARMPPVAAPSLAALADTVRPGEFASRRALVIGGSRGLGAVTAKLIAAGGGSVTVTYARGRRDAEAIEHDITSTFEPGRCRILRYNTAEDAGHQLASADIPFTHVYFFASGQISGSGPATTFDSGRFDDFIQNYVVAFDRLVDHLLAVLPDDLRMFYPSTVFVETRPRGMTEYAMAKAAGEILCADLGLAHRRLTITAPRLPRLLTDQTSTVPPVPAADPLETMLALLRSE